MISQNIEELAENKLVLLYILSETNLPLSKNQMTQIVMENDLMNYFSMQQFLAELVQRNLVVYYEDMGKYLYTIQQEGLETLRLFASRIPLRLKETLKRYLQEKEMLLEKETRSHSSYSREDKNTFSVVLRLIQGGMPIMEIRLKTDTERNAEKMCSNWNTDGKALYQSVTKLLTNDQRP